MGQNLDILLTREVRLAATSMVSASEEANNFAANPAPDGLVPVVTLGVQIMGPVQLDTGMLVNIKRIDHIIRDIAAPALASLLDKKIRRIGPGLLLAELFNRCAAALTPHTMAALTLQLSPWMYYQTCRGEMPMLRMAQRFEFSAAHRLHNPGLSAEINRQLFGKCNNPNGHGHNYELEVVIGGTPEPQTGQIMQLLDFQRLVNQHVIEVFDHKHLNMDCPEFAALNPTVENIAQVIFAKIREVFPAGVKLLAVKVWETPKTCCEVRAP
ncbi:MAG: 6-pyruvoyl trahydropterin synthase family protein [Phycisphaerae bacterium]